MSWKRKTVVVGLVCIGFLCGSTFSYARKSKKNLRKAGLKKVWSPAAAYGWSRPPKWAALSEKTQKILKRGKVQVSTKYLKNEHGKSMMVVQCRAIIKSPPKEVFKTLADLNNAHKFMPGMYYSKVIRKLGPHTYHVVRKVKMAWVKLALNIRIQLFPNHRYQFNLMRHLKNDIKDSVGSMVFEPIHGGKHTLYTYRSYADSGRWVPGFIRRAVLGGTLPKLVKQIGKRTRNRNWKQK